MSESTSFNISPNRGLGWIALGASLYAVLTRLRSSYDVYPKIELLYATADPIQSPVVINLPGNGIRLRFDGPDQRLHLIELTDFSKSNFSYKSQDLVRRSTSSNDTELQVGPSFKHLYNRLFGPSYPGEYIPPTAQQTHGTYVLSWPGLAARFSVKHQLWSEKADFVSQLAAHASPAVAIAIFSGSSWPEVRNSLYAPRLQQSRAPSVPGKVNDGIPDDIDEVLIHENGTIEMVRRTSAPFVLTLNETTSQDLIMEIGPPDAIFKRPAGGLSINATQGIGHAATQTDPLSLDQRSIEEDQISARHFTDDSEAETGEQPSGQSVEDHSSVFYNYFNHGFDVMMANKSAGSLVGDTECLVAVKIFLHGNVPGSYLFNRHRRCRWQILLDDNGLPLPLTSEMKFQEISAILEDLWEEQRGPESKRTQQGMVLNRGWDAEHSPDSSIELLGGFDDQSEDMFAEKNEISNTVLFGYPGFLFEVLKDDSISCLTVYDGSCRKTS